MVNDFLPEKEELQPILNDKNTFYECGFNDEFDNLSFEKRLQIVCDVVRQSIYPSVFPNPLTTTQDLIGNCYTAALVSKKYLERLKIGKNIKIVFGKGRYFEPDDITTIHMLNLVEDEKGQVYHFDATPFVGFGMGRVKKINEPLYHEYVEVNDEIHEIIKVYLEILYDNSNNLLDTTKLKYYVRVVKDALSYEILNGYTAKCLRVLNNYFDNDNLLYISNKIKKYSSLNEKEFLIKKDMVFDEIKKWEEELKELLVYKEDYKRQLELAQNIIQEKKMYDSSYEIMANLNNFRFRLSFINPRVLKELGLNTVMLKPSAYFIEKENEIKNKMLGYNKISIGDYYVDLSKKTPITSIKPMIFSHPLGEEYIRSMMGTSNVFLVNDLASNLKIKKQRIRSEYCQDMWNKDIIWYDGDPILWHPFVTNLVHTADDYSESALHYLIGYPEHQAMTRFMYPNPKMKEAKK